MPTRRKTVAPIAGGALIAAALLWHFRLGERWTQRVRPGWNLKTTYIGTRSLADPKTSALPARDAIVQYDHTLRVASESDRPRSVVLEDRYRVTDVRSNRVIWDHAARAVVDPRTGAHAASPYAGDVVLFPREVRQQTYRFRSNYLEGIPLAFLRAEDLQGLATYLFAYRGRAEYTATLRDIVPTTPAQEIRCADDQFYHRVWVEPRTGAIVKLEEGCPSGSYVYDRATGRALRAVGRWSRVTSGRHLRERVEEVRRLRAEYLWASRFLPLSLAVGGLLALGAGLLPRREDELG